MKIPEYGNVYRFSPIASKRWTDATWEEVWKNCLKHECMCFGWGRDYGDLTDADPVEVEANRETSTYLNIVEGDLIIANRGKNRVLAVGLVKEPPREFEPDAMQDVDTSRQPHSGTWKNVLRVEWLPDSAGIMPNGNGIGWVNALSPIKTAEDRLPELLENLNTPLGETFPTGKIKKDKPYNHSDEDTDEEEYVELDLDNILVAKIQDCPWKWRRAYSSKEREILKSSASMDYVKKFGDIHESRNFDPKATDDEFKYFYFQVKGKIHQRFDEGRGLVFWLSTDGSIVGLSAWCELSPNGQSFEANFDDGSDRVEAGLDGNWNFNLRCPDNGLSWCEFGVPVPLNSPEDKQLYLGDNFKAKQPTYFKLTPQSAAQKLLERARELQIEANTHGDKDVRDRADRAHVVIEEVLWSFQNDDEETMDTDADGNHVFDELAESPNHAVILQGPAGTGKTWVANKVKDHYEANGGKVVYAQFHPAYTYEDFIEGLRPKVNKESNQLEYNVESGVFKKFCEDADAASDKTHLFIIDEINRGNIPKIFGEIMRCIEYRSSAGEGPGSDSTVSLPYSQEPFSIPNNVHILGTMNTSDRSIAMLDIALRRRFSFIDIMPDPSVVKDGLLELDGREVELANVMRGLNGFIEKELDRDRTLGHSYFMMDKRHGSSGNLTKFKKTWVYQIVPLLREYFIGNERTLKDFLGKEMLDVSGLDGLSDVQFIEYLNKLSDHPKGGE